MTTPETKLSPEQASKEWVDTWLPASNSAYGISTYGQKAYLAGATEFYERGKAEAEQRIWERITQDHDLWTRDELKQIIFGGGDAL